MPNRFTPIQPGTDPSQQMAIINKNFAELDNETVKKLYDDSTGTHRIFIDASVPVIKISKAGVDVTTATDDQLTFNSQQNVFKIVKKISTAIPAWNTTYNGVTTYGGSQIIVPHGLTFTPIVNAYAKAEIVDIATSNILASTYVPLPIIPAQSSNFNQYWFPDVANINSYLGVSIVFGVTDTNIYLSAYMVATGNHAASMAAIPVTLFLLQESAT